MIAIRAHVYLCSDYTQTYVWLKKLVKRVELMIACIENEIKKKMVKVNNMKVTAQRCPIAHWLREHKCKHN